MRTRRQFLAASALLAGCNRSRRKVIGVVPKATSHLFFVSVRAGVEQAAKDLNVEVIWNGPNDETDHTRQIQIVDAMVARRVDGLAISATDERALAAPLERAIRAGIPVSVFDSAVNIEDYVTFVATNNYGAGVTAAQLLAKLIGGDGKVGMVMQQPGGASTTLRERAFEDTLTKDFARVNIAARNYCGGDRARSRAVAENILTAHPNLKGIFASSEAASIGSVQAIRGRGLTGKVKLVGFDSSETHIGALRDGTMDVTMLQDTFKMGYESVRSLVEALAGRTPQKRLDLAPRPVTKADMDDPEIQPMLFPPWMKDQG